MYAIETNIPVPQIGGRGRKSSVYPFAQMNVGDSFFVPGITTTKITGTVFHHGKRLNMKFVTRTVDGGVRVWRTK